MQIHTFLTLCKLTHNNLEINCDYVGLANEQCFGYLPVYYNEKE